MNRSYEAIYARLPKRLHQFIVDQDYDAYTPQAQAIWRYIMRRNMDFLSKKAHPAYLDGLKKTGIGIEKIPHIDEMNAALSKIGWSAVVVDGFIPPAAFMEFQAHKVLVISAEMRTIEHVLYTPAPDIVHEAAGHAPIIADPQYAEFLRKFGEYGAKAMASQKDMEVYEAIRYLSIIKEYPHATAEQVKQAEQDLEEKIAANKKVSEAQKLSRLHWWTVEYGLYGKPDDYLLYGAGLLSSVGEAQACMKPKVKKIALSVDCVNYNYDITNMQPQLFVNEDWQHLTAVLEEFADSMCFRTGGMAALQMAVESESVNTAQYASGLQVSGKLTEVLTDKAGREAYLKFSGPAALAFEDKQLPGHGIEYHADGFGSPVGKLKGQPKAPELLSDADLEQAGLKIGSRAKIEFESGIVVEGIAEQFTRRGGKLLLITWRDCSVTGSEGQLLFNPAWGIYDMAVGERITSVFAGTADKEKYDVFPAKSERKAITIEYSQKEKALFELYRQTRQMRESNTADPAKIEQIHGTLSREYPRDWLLRLELLELLELLKQSGGANGLAAKLETELQTLSATSEEYALLIEAGLGLV